MEQNPNDCKHYKGVCAQSERCYRPCIVKCGVHCSDFTQKHKCGHCAYLVSNEGEPYYCSMKDLYTFVGIDDVACPDYIPNKNNHY